MISTRLKLKLPKTLSFPVSLNDVAEALSESPEWNDASLVFWSKAVWQAAAFRKILSERLPYTILDAEYRSEPIASETAWTIRIYPVVRSERHVVGQLLTRDGLSLVARWSGEHRNEGWRARDHRLEIILDPSGPSLGHKVWDSA